MHTTGRRLRAATFAASVLALTSSLVLTACAAAGTGGTAPTPTSPIPSWGTYAPSDVTAIRQSSDQTRLTIDLTMPNALSDHECWRSLTGGVYDFSEKSTIIRVTAESWSDPRCLQDTTTTESVSVDLPAPLGARTVNVNNSTEGDYIADPVGSPTLRYCYGFRCGPLPPATCDASSVHDAAGGAEVGAHARYTVRGCDGQWLVLDFTWTGGPACDNACPTTGVSVARWFYRGTNQGWRAIVSTTTAGCAAVLAVEPAFPTALCESLDQLR